MKKKSITNLRLNKKQVSHLQGGAEAPNPVSYKIICNTGCDTPVQTCGIINCNLTVQDCGADK